METLMEMVILTAIQIKEKIMEKTMEMQIQEVIMVDSMEIIIWDL